MSNQNSIAADYLFEVSWEVCNKIGGIHTVIATKALNLRAEMEDRHILIGPDVWRDTHNNPEFLEDVNIFKSWKSLAVPEGIRVRTGRWNIPGNPVVILVDFSALISKKDEILADLWLKYGLDSLNGRWDYIESVLFGIATGRVIESFIKYNLSSNQKSIAQFHEWMTGSGILYLQDKHFPLATVFTTHATVVGRCLAGNHRPLYDSLEIYNSDNISHEFNVSARHSLEKRAAKYSDIFTTVSEITARECRFFLDRIPDIITPNGFEKSFVPNEEENKEWIDTSRATLINLAKVMTGFDYYDDVIITGTGGRYEYSNKGIDLFLDSLGELNRRKELNKTILAFLFIPAGHNGPNKDLQNALVNHGRYLTNCTHMLQEPDYDPILNRIKELGLLNRKEDNVKVFFVPSYLNGNDGILNINYYRLLCGLDVSVFPSYYEPWGYTPLESLAFGVPTITTTLAGFGLWVKEHFNGNSAGIAVIERDEKNYGNVVANVTNKILEISVLNDTGKSEYRKSALAISQIALWENLIIYYKKAYFNAIKILLETKEFNNVVHDDKDNFISKKDVSNTPNWTKILISKQLPTRLQHLDTLSKNLWWSWNQNAIDLYESIDSDLWNHCKGNPILMLDKISLKKYQKLEKDSTFLGRLDSVYSDFEEYMAAKDQISGPKVAYFSMEYGLDKSLKIYSGGLGVLAGDYLKESSDKMVPITGIGLLYRYGYFNQKLTSHGDQVADYEAQDFTKIPATPVRDAQGNWISVNIALPGRNMYARLWRVDVGRTELYLMDTDFEENLPEDRSVTHQLYGGDWENRLKQEILLGIGGIRALRALGKDSEVYHCNEGHAAFIGLERLREYICKQNLSFAEALEVVRASSLFTTHTPVPAGHDAFSEDLLRGYMSHYPERLKIDWNTMMALGKIDPANSSEKFSMSYLASNLSQEINGVSYLHGEVSKEILAPLWQGYLPQESHVSYVTNGVHYPTWTAPEWKEVHSTVFGENFKSHNYDKSCFSGIYTVENAKIWEIRTKLRKRLIKTVKDSLSDPSATAHYPPHHIVTIKENLRDDILTIGFARRFATYKRAHLLFTNLERLDQIVNNPERPVQFLFAGKAHPADKAGQDLIKRIAEVSLMPQFLGKILFVPGYDMTLAKALVQGVDIWMNTPTRPLEASGTSGEKAVMNGVMHFSVLDGWWVEGYVEGAGWALPQENTYSDSNYQDELDAATIYNMLENDIAPIFYENDQKNNLPEEWIAIIKNTVAKVACNFTTNRMLSDYEQKYYSPMAQRCKSITENDFALARELAFWKKRVKREWENVAVKSYSRLDISKSEMNLGIGYPATVELYIGELDPQEIGIEMLLAEEGINGKMNIKEKFDFTFDGSSDGVAYYSCEIKPETAGIYNFAGRIYAKNPKLPHRQDFDLVKWL